MESALLESVSANLVTRVNPARRLHHVPQADLTTYLVEAKMVCVILVVASVVRPTMVQHVNPQIRVLVLRTDVSVEVMGCVMTVNVTVKRDGTRFVLSLSLSLSLLSISNTCNPLLQVRCSLSTWRAVRGRMQSKQYLFQWKMLV